MYAIHSLACVQQKFLLETLLLLLSPFFLFARARGCTILLDQDQAISKSYYTSSLSSLLLREDFMLELRSIRQWVLCQIDLWQSAHQKPVGRGAD